MIKKYYKEKEVDLEEKRFSDSKYNGQTFTTQMDPNAEGTQYPPEYPIVSTKALRHVDVEYIGNVTDADNTVGIATLERQGPLYHAFDAFTMPVAVQYKGLSIPSNPNPDDDNPDGATPNVNYNASFARSGITTLSAASATQFTELGFLTAGYKTNIPAMTEGDEAIIGALVYYASGMCNLQEIIQAYNNLKAQKDQLVKMGFNAEAPRTIELMNLLSKANVRTLFEQLGNILHENFVDSVWMQEVGVIGNIPSREFFDMLSPLKAISAYHKMPHLQIFTDREAAEAAEVDPDTIVFDSHSSRVDKIQITLDLPEGNPMRSRVYTFEGLVQHILDLLNPVMLLGFTRQQYWAVADNISTPLEDYAEWMNNVSYVNDLIRCVSRLVDIYSYISTAMVDLKTFLMLLQERTDLNGWLFGSTAAPTDQIRRQIDWFNYELVDQLFRAYYSGGANLVVDGNTRKWSATSVWDYQKGIPKFDFKEGGMAIAASVRDIAVTANWGAPNENPMYDFPVVFTPNPITCALYLASDSSRPAVSHRHTIVYSRHGEHCYIVRDTMNREDISISPYMSRLNIVPTAIWESLAIPYAVFANETQPDNVLLSNIARFMSTQFGICGRVGYGGFQDEDPDRPVLVVTNMIPRPSDSAIGLVTREFDDFPSIAEEYIRKTAPLRLSGGPASLGFALR